MPLITNTVLQETIRHVVYCFATCSAMRDTNGDIMTTQGGEQQPLVTEECSRNVQTQSGSAQKLTNP